MRVLTAQSAGFCWGVQQAVDKARRLALETGGAVHTDGPLIHNEQMLACLRAEGIRETDDPAALRDGTLMIRAHGIPPSRRAWLAGLPVCLADATCRDVARIQGLIRKHAARGFHTVIFGDPEHAEVLGLLGFAEGRGHVVQSPKEVEALPAGLEPVCLVAQSTEFVDFYAAVAAAIRRRYPGAVVLDTICAATRERQAELGRLAREADAVVVVGGRASANTLRLVELARRDKPTFHVQTAADLDTAALRAFRTVALTAGASTPDFLIAEVRRALESVISNR